MSAENRSTILASQRDIFPHIALPDTCNASRIRYGHGLHDFVYLGRDIIDSSQGVDVSRLTTYNPNGKHIAEFPLQMPQGIHFFEDPRTSALKKDSLVFVGGTAVAYKNTEGTTPYYAAGVLAKLNDGKLEQVSDLVVFPQIEGKNMTPDDYDVETNEVNFRARIDNSGTTHVLSNYTYNMKTGELRENAPTHIPRKRSNERRTGTVGRMIDGYGLVHGQETIVDSDGLSKIAYSLDAVKVHDGQITHITESPIIRRSHLPPGSDRHTRDKIIVYSTDTHDRVQIIETGEIVWQFATSTGDRRTELTYIPEETIKAQLVPVEQLNYALYVAA